MFLIVIVLVCDYLLIYRFNSYYMLVIIFEVFVVSYIFLVNKNKKII